MHVISVSSNPEFVTQAISYFQGKWASPESLKVYEDCILHSLNTKNPLPQWYLLLKEDKIIGCAGLITNDFISRMDLYPWLCALYIEEHERHHAYGSILIEHIKQEAKKLGFNSLYLCTDHIGYYEKYDFHYVGLGYHPWGETSRIYEAQLEEKTTHRKYYALVWGVIKNDTGTIDAPIGRDPKDRKKMAVVDNNSKDAVTHFKVLERYKNATLIELKLETGRTHQIRVHMKYIGHPVVNDAIYSNRKLFDETGQCLHAKELGFVHPTTNKYMEFDSKLPECFINIKEKLENE